MFDTQVIVAGLLFGAIGFIAFWYGRKMELWKPLAIGLGLMVYPYFFQSGILLWGVGSLLVVLLWFHHDE